MPDLEKPEFTKQSLKGFMMRVMMMLELWRKKEKDQGFLPKNSGSPYGVLSDKTTPAGQTNCKFV